MKIIFGGPGRAGPTLDNFGKGRAGPGRPSDRKGRARPGRNFSARLRTLVAKHVVPHEHASHVTLVLAVLQVVRHSCHVRQHETLLGELVLLA